MTLLTRLLGLGAVCAVLLAAQQAPAPHISLVDQFQKLYTVYDRASETGKLVPFLATAIAPDKTFLPARRYAPIE